MLVQKKNCRLVLDSCCDLPREILDNAGVEFFRFPFIMNDGEHSDDLGETMSPKEFYDRLRNGEVSGTAQIPLQQLTEKLEEYAEDGTPMVYLAFTAGLSGTFETVTRLVGDLQKKYPKWECYVVDSLLASVAEGLLAYEAIRQYQRGMTAAELAAWAEEARWYVNCLFTCDGLESLRRGGRIPDAAARLGEKLSLNPLLNFNADGTLALAGVARGRKKSLKALVEEFKENHDATNAASETIIVGSADDEGSARWVSDHLDLGKNSIPPLMCSIGPTIGSHVGPNMVAIVFWGDDRRKNISIADRIAGKLKGKK